MAWWNAKNRLETNQSTNQTNPNPVASRRDDPFDSLIKMEQYRSQVIANYEAAKGGGVNAQQIKEIIQEVIEASNPGDDGEDGIDRIARLAELLKPLLSNLPTILGTGSAIPAQAAPQLEQQAPTGAVGRLSPAEVQTIINQFAEVHPKLLKAVRKGTYSESFCIANLKAQGYTEADAKAIYDEAMKEVSS